MNLNFASVWEMIADLVPDNDALICGEDIVSWKSYDSRSSKVASALSNAGLGANSKAGLYLRKGLCRRHPMAQRANSGQRDLQRRDRARPNMARTDVRSLRLS